MGTWKEMQIKMEEVEQQAREVSYANREMLATLRAITTTLLDPWMDDTAKINTIRRHTESWLRDSIEDRVKKNQPDISHILRRL